MQTHFHCMSVDRTKIKTRLAIHPDLFSDPNAFIQDRNLDVRTSKLTRGKSQHGPTQNLTLDVLTYKGIKAKLTKVSDEPLTGVTIDFNPGKCLYIHNGSALLLPEFLDALSILVNSLTPLLSNPDDQQDLVPGLRTPGVAYWNYLETYLQCDDSEGKILAGFRHAQRDNPNTAIRHWPTSIEIGGKKSTLQFAIYCKADEMMARLKLPRERFRDYEGILRLEVRLKDNKLVHYLGNERNVEEIDGVSRLVRFYPRELVDGHRKSFSELQGVFRADEPLGQLGAKDQLTPLGRLLARVALDPRTSMTLPELLSRIRFYTGAGSDTIKGIRKAGQELIASQSKISQLDLFSDVSYQRQLSVAIEALENEVCHEIKVTAVHRLMYAAYQPPDLPFQPRVYHPTYERV